MHDLKTLAWLDQDDKLLASHIRRRGWRITAVGMGPCACCGDATPGEPGFAYTIGLFGYGHPELLIFGVPYETASRVLNDLGRRIRAGADLVPGELLEFKDWPHRIVPEEVPNPGDIVFGANRHYRRPRSASVPVLQLTYDDKRGRFPWDDGYAIPPEIQPRPGTFSA